MSIYNFEVALEDGTVYSLEKYAGKPIIIINTATKCGLAPQFEQLEKLYQTYQSQDLVIWEGNAISGFTSFCCFSR